MNFPGVHIDCPGCGGFFHVKTNGEWVRCAKCDGIGRVWAPNAPRFDCPMTLADRNSGEIVELGTGQRARILWHMPKRAKNVEPETTFLGLIDDFDDYESTTPVPCPSVVGVRSVSLKISSTDESDHAGEKGADAVDPLNRNPRTPSGALL